jgi:hypothetical protein
MGSCCSTAAVAVAPAPPVSAAAPTPTPATPRGGLPKLRSHGESPPSPRPPLPEGGAVVLPHVSAGAAGHGVAHGAPDPAVALRASRSRGASPPPPVTPSARSGAGAPVPASPVAGGVGDEAAPALASPASWFAFGRRGSSNAASKLGSGHGAPGDRPARVWSSSGSRSQQGDPAAAQPRHLTSTLSFLSRIAGAGTAADPTLQSSGSANASSPGARRLDVLLGAPSVQQQQLRLPTSGLSSLGGTSRPLSGRAGPMTARPSASRSAHGLAGRTVLEPIAVSQETAGTASAGSQLWGARGSRLMSPSPGPHSEGDLPTAAGAGRAIVRLDWNGILAVGRHLPGAQPLGRGAAGAGGGSAAGSAMLLMRGSPMHMGYATARGLGELDLLAGSVSQWRVRLLAGADMGFRVDLFVGVSEGHVLRRLRGLLPEDGARAAGRGGAATPAAPAAASAADTAATVDTVTSERQADVIAAVSALPAGASGPTVVGVWSGMYAMHANETPATDVDADTMLAAAVAPDSHLLSLSATRAGLDATVSWSPLSAPADTSPTNCKLQLAAVGLHMMSHERFVAALRAATPARFQTVVQVSKGRAGAIAEWRAPPLPYAVVEEGPTVAELALDWPLGLEGVRS